VSEALIGAVFIRRFVRRPGLNDVRAVIVFCSAAVMATFFSSFLDAGFVQFIRWGEVDYWSLWQVRFLTNILATLTFVPVVLTLVGIDPANLRGTTPARWLEGGALMTGLLAVSLIVFDSGITAPDASSAFLYLPLPFLLWAAVRFGPPLTSACFTVVAFLVIWGARNGRGPFLEAAIHDNALPIQLFLISIAVPLLFLAAVIQERRQAERKLRASEARFSTAFKCSPDAMAISRRSDGRIIDVNERWLALLGYEQGQLGRGEVAPLAAHANESDRARLVTLTHNAVDVRDLEITLRNCQGKALQTMISIERVELDGEACLISTVRDITDQRRAELEAREQRRQLTHLTRIASLTDFSGVLAHELKQPLTAILSNVQAAQRFLARDPPDIPEIRSILADIAEADKRAGAVIQRQRLLMKKGHEEFAPLDLNELVREVLDFARSELVTRNVSVSSSFTPHPLLVNGDRVQLQQVVLNLVSNACEALEGHNGSEKSLNVTIVHGNEGTGEIVISDTGPGIPWDQMDRIFEPFFTTKENGLGLGLSICRTIARAHGGTLAVENHSDGGARFRLLLPPAQLAQCTAARLPEPSLDR
jgi:PAS domain S-box-containing protein